MASHENNSPDPSFRPLIHGQFEKEITPSNQSSLENDELFLIRAVADNPDKGIELVYRRYFQPLCSHAVKYVGSRAVAEDLVSEVFYEFYRAGTYTAITTSYRFYLFRAVRNRAFNHVKSSLNHAESFHERYEPANNHSPSPEAISEFEELYQDVQKAINFLPVNRRKVYLMNRFEGRKYQEIADELGLSVKTVEVQLYRANKFVRSFLREKWLPVFFLFIHELTRSLIES